MFLSSLPANYDQLKHILKYVRKSLTPAEVFVASRFKERELAELQKLEKGSATVFL